MYHYSDMSETQPPPWSCCHGNHTDNDSLPSQGSGTHALVSGLHRSRYQGYRNQWLEKNEHQLCAQKSTACEMMFED